MLEIKKLYLKSLVIFLLGISQLVSASSSCQLEQETRQDSWWQGDWHSDITSHYVSFENTLGTPTRYHYLENDQSNKPAQHKQLVILLHGFPELSWAWEKELIELGKHHQVVAVDLKGFYKSDKPSDIAEYDFAMSAGEIVQVAKCLGYEKFHLVGHDMGGALSWLAGHLFPQQIASLTVLNAPHPMVYSREYYKENSAQKAQSHYIDKIRQQDTWTTMKLFWQMQDDTSLRDTGFYHGWRIGRLMLQDWSPMFSYYRSMPYPPPKPSLRSQSPDAKSDWYVTVPTQLLWGTQDHYLIEELSQDLDSFVADVEVKRFPQADHWLNHTVDISALLQDFVVKHSPQSTASVE